MVIQKKYRQSPEHLTSYDYIDVANGLGYQTYYLNQVYSSGEDTTKILAPSLFPADAAITTLGSGNHTFDTSEFNTTRIIRGVVYLLIRKSGGAGQRVTGIYMYIVHADASTTTIVTDQDASNVDATTCSVNLPIDRVVVRKGEKIRLLFNLDQDTFEIGANAANYASRIMIPFEIP